MKEGVRHNRYPGYESHLTFPSAGGSIKDKLKLDEKRGQGRGWFKSPEIQVGQKPFMQWTKQEKGGFLEVTAEAECGCVPKLSLPWTAEDHEGDVRRRAGPSPGPIPSSEEQSWAHLKTYWERFPIGSCEERKQ